MSASPLQPRHPGFLVWNPNGHQTRYVHRTLDEAKTEARRLAGQCQGEMFYVLVPVGAAYIQPTRAEFHTMNPLPLEDPGQADDLDADIPF